MFDWFFTGDEFVYLSEVVAEWLAFGLGLGAMAWVLSVVIGFIWSFIRY